MDMNQNSEHLHFQLPTTECWSHTWRQPTFQFIHSNHHNGERFNNLLPRPQGRGRTDLLKWLFTRKAFTWDVDLEKEYAEQHITKRLTPHDRPHASIDDWQV